MARGGKLEFAITMEGSDKASASVKEVEKSLDSMGNKAGKAGKRLKGAGGKVAGLRGQLEKLIPGGKGTIDTLRGMTGGAGGASVGFLKLAGGLAAAGAALMAFRGQAEEAAALEFRISRLGETLTGTTLALKRLQIQSGGVYSITDLTNFMTVQKEMNVDLGITGEGLKKLDLRFTALGLSMSDGLRQMTEAIKTGRQMYLQKLGLVDNLTEAWKAEAKSVGHVLSQQEKMVVTVREVKEGLSRVEEGGVGGITEFERIGAILSDMGQDVAAMLIPVFKMLRPVIEAVGTALKALFVFFRAAFEVIAAAVGPLLESLNGLVGILGASVMPMLSAVAELFASLANTMMGTVKDAFDIVIDAILASFEGIGQAIIDVKNLGFALTDFLQLTREEDRLQLAALQRRAEQNKLTDERIEAEKAAFEIASKERTQDLKFRRLINKNMREAEITLLELKKQNKTITDEEADQLRLLKASAKVEGASAKIEATKARLINEQNRLINQQIKMMFSPELFTVGGGKKFLDLGKRIAGLAGKIGRLSNIKVAVKLEGAKRIRDKGKGGGKGKKEEAEKEAPTEWELGEKDRLSDLNEEKFLRLKLENELIGTTGERVKALLQLDIAESRASDLRIKGHEDEADLMQEKADLQYKITLAKLDSAAASGKMAEQEKKLAKASGAMNKAIESSEGKTKAVAMSMQSAASIAGAMTIREQKLGAAILANSGPMSAAAQQFAESEAHKAKIAGAMELAYAAAAFAVPNPILGLAHLAAAALFFKTAASSGAAAPAAPPMLGRVGARGSEGPRQVVINFSGIITDPQRTARDISSILTSQRGTGIA